MNGKVKTDAEIESVELAEEDLIVQKVDSEDNKELQEREKEVHYAYKVLWTILVSVEILLFLKFLLELLDANPESLFYQFIIFVTAVFMLPFQGIFESYDIVLFEESINELFAMFSYFMLFIIGVSIIKLFHPIEDVD